MKRKLISVPEYAISFDTGDTGDSKLWSRGSLRVGLAPLALDAGLGIDVSLFCRVLILQLSVSHGECERIELQCPPFVFPYHKWRKQERIR